jgi:predicted secreted protein
MQAGVHVDPGSRRTDTRFDSESGLQGTWVNRAAGAMMPRLLARDR